MLFRLPEKQKELLVALAKEGTAQKITSGSSVQSAVKGLLEKDFITFEKGDYKIYDRFFELWILEKY